MKKTELLSACMLICVSLSAIAFKAPETPKPDFGGEKRIAAWLSCDKTIYKTGETIRFRVIALEAFGNFPVRENLPFRIRIKDARGALVRELHGSLQDSTGGVVFPVPGEQPSGVYRAFCTVSGSAEAERSFEIRAYSAPRLKTQIAFLKDAYGAGEEVHAFLSVRRAEGGVPENADITLIARLDSREIARIPNLKINREGNLSTSFRLPETLAGTDGTLAFLIRDGGVVETAAKTLPLVLPDDLEVTFYPEGGDLVAGLPCRVYVSAAKKDGKPASFKGRILDARGRETARVETRHEGRGVFAFVPEKDGVYALVVDAPAGIGKHFPLPRVKASGAALRATEKIYPRDGKIILHVSLSPGTGGGSVALSRRERVLCKAPLRDGGNEVALDPGEFEGVLIATVYDSRKQPLAERLVFRAPKYALRVRIEPGGGPFTPGGKVRLNITSEDRNGNPVESIVGVNVTDESVLEMTECREQPPTLPVMVYLENDVLELADAQIYFDERNPGAPEALDLLLGTQGWRRFITLDFRRIAGTYENPAKRALAWMDRNLLPVPGNEVMPACGMVAWKSKAVRMNVLPVPEALPPFREMIPVLKQDKIEAKEMNFSVGKPDRIHLREYAHRRANRMVNVRSDFTETICWNAGIRTNPRTGRATVSFDLPDSITTFRVTADAIGNNGALGVSSIAIPSMEPFHIEPKLPVLATVGDEIRIPVAVANAMDRKLDQVTLSVKADGILLGNALTLRNLAPGARGRMTAVFRPRKSGVAELVFHAVADGHTDKVIRTIRILPAGFPVVWNAGGVLSASKSCRTEVTIPEDADPASVAVEAKLYPSPLAGLEEALNALLRQPCGCFEQTSATTYPLVMAQQYFRSHSGVSPEKIRKAAELLKQGYRRLTGFESKSSGYEWFGGNPGHEALTAYGLMQFHEMKEVMAVNGAMFERTKNWLMSRRDGRGGFLRNKRALDSFGRAPAPTTDAYILWTLLESGTNPAELSREIEHVKKLALESKDSYLCALGANILFLAKDHENAMRLASALAASQEKDGSVSGAVHSITCSGGDSLALETTSLAVIAWLRIDPKFMTRTEAAMKWIFERCRNGRFGSTQSTILALKAVNAYDRARPVVKKSGSVQLLVDGKAFGSPVAFTPESREALVLPDFSPAMTPGRHTLELVMHDGSEMPFTLEVSCHTKLPASDPECALRVETRLSASQVREGEIAELIATVRNGGAKDVSMPLAVVGIPAGFEVRADQLKELVKAGRIASWEMFRGELVLYWRSLRAGESVRIPVSLKAMIPGVYTAPASRAWLYYTEERRDWCPGVTAEIF